MLEPVLISDQLTRQVYLVTVFGPLDESSGLDTRMAIIRLGKTREATGFTSERYKSAIRKYMESMGYAQLTDSRYEGHVADMVFGPLGQAPWSEVPSVRVPLQIHDFCQETGQPHSLGFNMG